MNRMLFVVALIFCGSAAAAPVSFDFTGHTVADPTTHVTLVDTSFSGSITFEGTNVVLTQSCGSGCTVGHYIMNFGASSGLPYGIQLDFDGQTYLADSSIAVTVLNDFAHSTLGNIDGLDLAGSKTTGLGDPWLYSISLSFRDFYGLVFSDTSLPLAPPALAEFNEAAFLFQFNNGSGPRYWGVIDSLTMGQATSCGEDCPPPAICTFCIPEPSTHSLLGLALIIGLKISARVRVAKEG
jgi:hypothetical protein